MYWNILWDGSSHWTQRIFNNISNEGNQRIFNNISNEGNLHNFKWHFYMASCSRIAQVTFVKKLQHWFLIQTWPDKAFKDTVVKLAFVSLHGGQLEIMLFLYLDTSHWSEDLINILFFLTLGFQIFSSFKRWIPPPTGRI